MWVGRLLFRSWISKGACGKHIIEVKNHTTEGGKKENLMKNLYVSSVDLFSVFYNQTLDNFDVKKHKSRLEVKMCQHSLLVRSSQSYCERCPKDKKNLCTNYIIWIVWQILLLKQWRRDIEKKDFLVEIYHNHSKIKFVIWFQHLFTLFFYC